MSTYVWQYFAGFMGLLKTLRAPFIVAVVCFAALVVPHQTTEIYHVLFEDWLANICQILFAIFLMVGVAIVFACCTIGLQKELGAGLSKSGFPEDRFFHWLAALVAASPLFSFTIGLLVAAPGGKHIQNLQALELQSLRNNLLVSASISLSLCVALVLVFRWRFSRAQQEEQHPFPALYDRKGFYAVSSALLITVALGTYFGVSVPVTLGPIAITALFLGFLTYYLSFCTLVYHRHRVPVLALLLVSAFAFSFWNDNHDIRAATRSTVGDIKDLRQAFHDWYSSRGDLPYYIEAGKPYPIYFVAAEGGGIYAAYHAAMFLARLQDTCPDFAQHTFAISGVSGGSLGAALFAGLAKKFAAPTSHKGCSEQPDAKGFYEQKVEHFLDTDFLAPVLWAGLFPDFFQRFLPFPVRVFDRSRGLERGFAAAWVKLFPQERRGFFHSKVRNAWDAKAASPALVLNTTETGWGLREVIAPFRTTSYLIRQSGYSLGAAVDVPVGSAVGLSARFPWLTPAGRYNAGELTLQLVDGGYFDNTGIETARNLISDLARQRPSTSAGSVDDRHLVLEQSAGGRLIFRVMVGGQPRPCLRLKSFF